MQALALRILHLKDISEYAGIGHSTTAYHLNELIRFGRVKKIGRGKYVLIDKADPDSENRDLKSLEFQKFFENDSNFSKIFPGGEGCKIELSAHEKNVLLEILSKENRYTPFTASQLAKNVELSVKSVIEISRNLEKKDLITMKKDGGRWVFIPKDSVVKALTEFLLNSKKGKNVGKTSSKKVKASKIIDVDKTNEPVLNTFEEYIAWQQHNSHRIMLQFTLLRCDHELLENTAWIFGQKAIRKHFPEVYIFKSKDAKGNKINVLPKKPFIFKDIFEFDKQLTEFINLLIERLKDYNIILDLSEPAEIKLQHEALENDEFARQAVRKGLLYFRCKTIIRKDNETLQIITGIDKSQALHIEFEGKQAHLYAQTYGEFVEDVATGRIKAKLLRELPVQNEQIISNISALAQVTNKYADVTTYYSNNINAHIETIKEQSEATRELRTSVHEFKEEVTGVVCELAEAVKTLTNTVNSKIEDSEDIVETTIVYSARRAKIPVNIHKKSNLRHNKSKRNTLTFRYQLTPSGHYNLTPVLKGRIRKTRYVKLPISVRRGSKLTWWLENKTICLKIQEVGSSEQ